MFLVLNRGSSEFFWIGTIRKLTLFTFQRSHLLINSSRHRQCLQLRYTSFRLCLRYDGTGRRDKMADQGVHRGTQSASMEIDNRLLFGIFFIPFKFQLKVTIYPQYLCGKGSGAVLSVNCRVTAPFAILAVQQYSYVWKRSQALHLTKTPCPNTTLLVILDTIKFLSSGLKKFLRIFWYSVFR